MQPNTAKTGKPREGFKQISNALIDNPNLCLRDKMVLIKLASHAYGQKTSAYPSQVKIAKCLGIQRETAKAALDSLTALGIIRPHGKGRKGKQETFTIDLDHAANLTAHPAGNLTAHPAAPDGSSGINKTAKENQEKKTLAPRSTSTTQGVDGPGDIEDIGICYAEAPDGSLGRFTKREINEMTLTPDLKLPDDEPDALECNLDVQLAFASGDGFNFKVLEELVELRGPTFCAFWTSWLLRKIAAEYAAGRPVKSPAGLYTQAVREGWEVDPSWPEFDENKHRTFTVEELFELDEIPF
jgi:hypothetical protein